MTGNMTKDQLDEALEVGRLWNIEHFQQYLEFQRLFEIMTQPDRKPQEVDPAE